MTFHTSTRCSFDPDGTVNFKKSCKNTPEACSALQGTCGAQADCTCEVGLGAAGFVARAAEGPGGAGVTVLRLWAATSQASHLTVCPIDHLYELSHPEERREEGRMEISKREEVNKDYKKIRKNIKRQQKGAEK